LNLAQDDSPGLDLKRRPVPEGRLKIDRDAILNHLQPSSGTKLVNPELSRRLIKASNSVMCVTEFYVLEV
jgi:hypothetical protein